MRVISRNLTAQGFSQIVTLIVQLGSVPLLIHAWGLESFGVWLLLTAIPVYLAFSDFGFTFVAKNEMSMRVAGDDRAGALEVFQSIFALLLLVAIGVGAVLAALIHVVPLGAVFDLGPETGAVARDVLLLQVGNVLLYQFFLLLCAGVRCEGRAATETVVAALARLGEAGAVVFAALAGYGLVGAALAGLTMRGVSLVVLALWLRGSTPWLRLGFGHARRAVLRRLAGPSVSYMMVPVSHAILIQAPVILLGAATTPAIVALYGVTRTVARLGVSGANVLSYAFTPEYSFAAGRGDGGRFRDLLRMHGRALGAGIAAYLLLGPFLLPWGVRHLSGGQIVPEGVLIGLLAAAVVFEMIWTAMFAPISAVNAHGPTARRFLILSGAALLAGVLMPGAVALAGVVALVHLAMIGVAALGLPEVLERARGAGPRRVSFLALQTFSAPGGVQRFNQRLIDSLVRQGAAAGWRLRVLVRGDVPDEVPEALRDRVQGLGRGRLALIRRMPGIIWRSDDLLLGHINLLPLGWVAKRLRPRLRLVLFVHGVEVWGDESYRKPRIYEQRMLQACDVIASVSDFTSSLMQKTYGLAEGRFVQFPNTIDVPEAKEAPEPRTGFLTVTRLAEHDRGKHVDAVLRAMAMLKDAGQCPTLRIVGDGTLRPELEGLARRLRIGAHVSFLGRVEEQELRRLYAEAQAFVLPSSKEGFGIVYLEAWANGLPVICSTEGAAPEVVRDGIDGFAVDPRDVKALAGRMAQLAADPALCARMAAAGWERIEERYLTRHLDEKLRQILPGAA